MSRPRSAPSRPSHRLTLRTTAPFRLDLTVKALHRLPQNRVDVLDGARYLRAFETPRGPLVWEITQEDEALTLTLFGELDDPAPYADLARTMLGTELDLAPFHARARRIRGFSGLARRFRGLTPPRFSCLWETLLNAIPFQQLSLASAFATLGRILEATSEPVLFGERRLYPLPSASRLAEMSERALARCGLSSSKAASLRRAAVAITSGSLDEARWETLPTELLREELLSLHGVGPWTAALMLLRGYRRLEVFPSGDAGAARTLREVLPEADPDELLRELGPYRGMLYFHLLLSRGSA